VKKMKEEKKRRKKKKKKEVEEGGKDNVGRKSRETNNETESGTIQH